MAHLLGTNLALWFWTLCSEALSELFAKRCLGGFGKYFSPLFVEYLLLAAGLFYQIWKDASAGDAGDPTMSLLQRYIHEQRNMSENTDSLSENGTDSNSTSNITIRSRRHNPSSCLGFIIGGGFAALFLVLVVFAEGLVGNSDHGYHIAYSVGSVILYLAQMCACFICQVSLQSHQHNAKHLSYDHEDILLYFSLIGIVLWQGFHAYSILLSGFDHASGVLDFGGDILAIAQHLFQTATLVKLRRHQRTQGQRPVWIGECIWFLPVTNLTLWVQDSFFIEVDITTPGERYRELQHELGAVGYIVHPLSIFYRFHSAVCCVLARTLFAN